MRAPAAEILPRYDTLLRNVWMMAAGAEGIWIAGWGRLADPDGKGAGWRMFFEGLCAERMCLDWVRADRTAGDVNVVY